jgi:hypothetical protein
MSVEVIILLGIFVWAPLMAYLGWKYVQTFSSVRESRAGKRRARRAVLLAADGHQIHKERRRVRRAF